MNRLLFLSLFISGIHCFAAEQPFFNLVRNENEGQFESVAHFAALGDTLAIATSYRERDDPNKGVDALRSSVVLVRDGVENARTRFEHGGIRAIAAISSGFIVARVVYVDDSPKCFTEVFSVNLKGETTAMPRLSIDMVGIWVGDSNEVFAYDARDVYRASSDHPAWEKVTLDPTVNAKAIKKIVGLKNGNFVVVTDRSIMGFKNLQSPPLYVKDLNLYPRPIFAYGDNQGWIVTSHENVEKLCRISPDGQIEDAMVLKDEGIKKILFSSDKVLAICYGQGRDIHKNFYYVLDQNGAGSPRGPYPLPDDTASTCVFGDSIVSGGFSNRVYKTTIPPQEKQ